LPLGARSILDDEWLVETRRQPLTNQAREDVGRAAGRKADQCALSLNFQLKNAPLWALGFICPRVHVSALSDRLGSELGVGFLHHRQRPCARRRWLRDPSRSRLYKVKEPQMSSLFFTCPTTRQQAPTGIETDVQSLRAAWKATRRGARNLSARDIYQWRAETTDFAGSSRGPPLDCLTRL
jgi:hypothetical protein